MSLRWATTLVMLGAGLILCVERDPLYGLGMIALVVGTHLFTSHVKPF